MHDPPTVPARILISGSSGAIGRALVSALSAVAAIGRLQRPGRPSDGPTVAWDPGAGIVDHTSLKSFAPTDIIHLAGESVFGRWTLDKKRRILDSRTRGTEALARAMAALEPRPRSFLSASAVGYYGDRGDEPLGESAPPGGGFLAEVCRDWEAAVAPAEAAGIRVARLRIGVVLDRASGPLRSMLPVYRLGLGGPIAGGGRWIPWITLHDTAAAIMHVLHTPSITGPVNIVSPTPVTQVEFARALGRRLHRPAIVPVPRALLTLALGEFARETALKSVRALPAALLASELRFTHPDLDSALAAIL